MLARMGMRLTGGPLSAAALLAFLGGAAASKVEDLGTEASQNMTDWWILAFFVYCVAIHVVLLAVTGWAWRVKGDYDKLISLAVSHAAVGTTSGSCVAELLNEYGRDELRDALRRWGEPVSGIKADLVSRLIQSNKGSVVDDRTARLMGGARQQTGQKIPLAAVLDSRKAAEYIKAAVKTC